VPDRRRAGSQGDQHRATGGGEVVIRRWRRATQVGSLLLLSGQLYVPLLVGLIPSVLIALVLGRVFCSWACPVNLLSEMMPASRQGRPLPRRTIWLALTAENGAAAAIGLPLFAIWSPPGLVGRELFMAVFAGVLAIEGLVLVAVLLMNLLAPRFFCRYLCPLGGLLALIGARRGGAVGLLLAGTAASAWRTVMRARPGFA
jgi:ferredoxin-type protein NapH